MQELINRITEATGITPDQALKAVETVKDFVKEKFPMMAGAVDNLFGSSEK
jgi:nucleoid DNA-binding protein